MLNRSFTGAWDNRRPERVDRGSETAIDDSYFSFSKARDVPEAVLEIAGDLAREESCGLPKHGPVSLGRAGGQRRISIGGYDVMRCQNWRGAWQ